MKKSLIVVGAGALILVGVFYALNTSIYEEKQVYAARDFKDGEYMLDGQRIRLENGVAEVEAAPGAASKVTTRYFGNEVRTDLAGDGREDIAFLLTNDGGGSGIFYYVVAALNTDRGYVGSDGYLLGDRIAPQTTGLSRNPAQKGVIVVNYADRRPDEPMTTQPSMAKSVYLKLDPASMRWGIVEPDFEGEADPFAMSLGQKTWTWVSALYNDGRSLMPKTEGAFAVTFGADGKFTAKTDCNQMGGTYAASGSTISITDIYMTKMFCEGSQEMDFQNLLRDSSGYHFTSKGELILDFKFDSGTATFR